MRIHSAILGGRFSGELFEHAVELRKRLKADRERDFTHAKIRVFQKFYRPFESSSRDIVNKFDAGHLFEFLAQVCRIDSRRVRDHSQRNVFAQMLFDKSACFPDISRFGSVPVVGEANEPSKSDFRSVL